MREHHGRQAGARSRVKVVRLEQLTVDGECAVRRQKCDILRRFEQISTEAILLVVTDEDRGALAAFTGNHCLQIDVVGVVVLVVVLDMVIVVVWLVVGVVVGVVVPDMVGVVVLDVVDEVDVSVALDVVEV